MIAVSLAVCVLALGFSTSAQPLTAPTAADSPTSLRERRTGAAARDNCDSGLEFPLRHEGSLLVGCSVFAGEEWCRREDSTFVQCPSLPLESEDDALALSPTRRHVSSEGTRVYISEILVMHDLFSDDDGESSDWIEIYNAEDTAVTLEGWSLTDNPDEMQKWLMPAFEVPSGGYVLVFASGKDRVSDAAAHTNFRLSRDGEYLALVRPDGSVASSIAQDYPRQRPNISYGLAVVNADGGDTEMMTFLEEPTPGAANAVALSIGPYIARVQHEHEDALHPANEDIVVTAVIAETAFPIERVSLTYSVMFGRERSIPMRNAEGDSAFTATIPVDDFTEGDMVRWFVTAVDEDGNESRDPVEASDYPRHYGTAIASETDTALPILYWFTDDPEASISIEGHRSAVFFDGRFYDNVFTRRRGVTALTWPKPKIKFDFKGAAFKFQKGESSVEEFNLQSFYDEIGEDSYMREPVAFQVHREAGVPASLSFHIHVRQNGRFFGLFAFVEQVDDTFLERNGFKIGGNLFKSVHGQFSNLRWDVRPRDMQYSYSKGNKIEVDNWVSLWEFTQGIAGGAELRRSDYLFEYLNIPEIINYMAVSNLLLNQDRCTKNFYVYEDPVSKRWSIFPWDTEASMGISSGLNGRPAVDYCVLVCEQWNSPFYCDSEHPQDLAELADLEIQTGRKLQQPESIERVRTIPRNFQRPTADVYNADHTSDRSLTGPDGTYNHLDDAILDWKDTREMYLRRLRTLMDQFLNGRLESIIANLYQDIEADAINDNEVWNVTPRVRNGVEQLLVEQLPLRREQLYEVYGPSGTAIIPEAQPSRVSLTVERVETPLNPDQQYIEISNPNRIAVDVSGWLLNGGVRFTFAPGTVIVAQGSIYVTPSIEGFRNRAENPKGGEGLFYVGPCSYMEPGISEGEIIVMNAQAQRI